MRERDRSFPVLVALLSITLIACAESSPNDAGPRPDTGPLPRASLELGEGEGRFRPMLDGDALDLVRGCQGSQHVWVALRARNIVNRRAQIELSARRDEDDGVVSQPFVVRLNLATPDGADYGEAVGLTLQIDEPDDVLGTAVTITARVEDSDGASAEASRSGLMIEWGDGGC